MRNVFKTTKRADASFAPRLLTLEEAALVSGGNYNRAGSLLGHMAMPGFRNPTVKSDDGVNVQTSGASTSNVGYDSPWTPIPA